MNCVICNSFRRPSHKPKDIQFIHQKDSLQWNELQLSAESCYCCGIILNGCTGCLKQQGLNTADVESLTLYFYYTTSLAVERDCQKLIHLRFSDGLLLKIEAFTLEDEDCPCPDSWDDVPTSARTSSGTGSDHALEKLQNWLDVCSADDFMNPDEDEDEDEDHMLCKPNKISSLPKRVVDVGLKDNIIRLLEVSEEKAPSSYIALSHCWGDSQIITTTKKTLELHKRSIPEQKLSKTFRQAIEVARRLNINYVWIDSLCIVQDDHLDWQIEASKMADVYQNAYFTIAATLSRNGDGGLFKDTPDFEIAGTTPLGEDYRLFFRNEREHVLVMENGKIDLYPLLFRGWCFQERLLSTRIVDFGPYELSFQCASGSNCECGGIYGYEAPLYQPKLAFADMTGSDTTIYARHRGWRSLVMQYSSLSLTKESDCLPALSGVAKVMARGTGSQYFAGVWKESLSDDLLWEGRGWHASRPQTWRAPTWSWASTNAYIYYADVPTYWADGEALDERDDTAYRHLSTLVSCQCEPAGFDTFGELKSATLELSGLCIDAILNYNPNDRTVEFGMPNPEIGPSSELPRGRRLRYVLSLSDDKTYEMLPDYDISHEGRDHIPSGTQVVCIRMSWTKTERSDESNWDLASLVLWQVGLNKKYQRIGVLLVRDRQPNLSIYSNAKLETVTII